MSKIATIQITFKVLKTLLHLPEEVEFLKVIQSWEQEESGVFEVLVTAPSLPNVSQGSPIPWGKIIARSEFCESDEKSHLVESKLELY